MPLCTVSRADRIPGSCRPDWGHVFACLLWIVVVHLLWAWGVPSSAPSCLPPRRYRELMKRDRGHAHHHQSLALGIGADSCTGYLTNYQTPCVEGHVCECVQYTTINRS
jgi:hypothetical protein